MFRNGIYFYFLQFNFEFYICRFIQKLYRKLLVAYFLSDWTGPIYWSIFSKWKVEISEIYILTKLIKSISISHLSFEVQGSPRK